MSTDLILGEISGCWVSKEGSSLCFFSRLTIEFHTSSRSAHFKFGSGQRRWTLAGSGWEWEAARDPGLSGSGEVSDEAEVDGERPTPQGEALR